MAILTGAVPVESPIPLVSRPGIFHAAIGPLDLPLYSRNGGLFYETGTCTLPLGYEVKCQTDHASKTFGGAVVTKTGYPFVVYSAITCGAVGLANYGQERIRKFLYEQLVSGEQAAVENIFSTSGFGQTEGLTNNPAVVDLGTAQGPVQAVSKLEDWLYARYGLPGIIHVPIRASSYLDGAFRLAGGIDDGEKIKTLAGSIVSIGNYAGTGPTGQVPAATESYIYITGQVAVWRTPDSQLLGDIPLGQVLNRATNAVNIVMEREYVVTYDCYVACVKTTLNTTDR